MSILKGQGSGAKKIPTNYKLTWTEKPVVINVRSALEYLSKHSDTPDLLLGTIADEVYCGDSYKASAALGYLRREALINVYNLDQPILDREE